MQYIRVIAIDKVLRVAYHQSCGHRCEEMSCILSVVIIVKHLRKKYSYPLNYKS